MKQLIRKEIAKAFEKIQRDKLWHDFTLPEYQVEIPDKEKFGDYSTNLAMILSKTLRMRPAEIAEVFKSYIKSSNIREVEIVSPGFINFFLEPKLYNQEINKILKEKVKYGSQDWGAGKKVQLEFISANPTGPLHMGNGRGGFTGDVMANVLRKVGYKTYKEYYINDAGSQIDTLGESVMRRYLQAQGTPVDYPEELYQGDYIKELAANLKIRDFKIKDQKKLARLKEKVKIWALEEMIKNIQEVVQKKCGIKFHRWFRESWLYENDAKEAMLDYLKKKDLIYLKDGAIWFKSSTLGDDKDRVIIKKDGAQTYFFSDVLYSDNRFIKRKYDKVIMLWGADHHGFVSRYKAISKVFDSEEKLKIILYQNVRLIFQGKELKMSKRKGVFVTLEELVDEVGIDAVRFFFLMNSLDKHMDFDLTLAKKKSDKNPVYYVQYAHARICSILNKVSTASKIPSKLEYLDPAEKSLIKELIKYPDIIEEIANTYEVQRLPFYAIEIARKFHNFYNHCRVIEDDKVNASRVVLIKSTKIVLNNVLSLMGVDAP
ncbi:MAG: arginine--tRNA ligase, partial [Patescibacteria group bacterium]